MLRYVMLYNYTSCSINYNYIMIYYYIILYYIILYHIISYIMIIMLYRPFVFYSDAMMDIKDEDDDDLIIDAPQ